MSPDFLPRMRRRIGIFLVIVLLVAAAFASVRLFRLSASIRDRRTGLASNVVDAFFPAPLAADTDRAYFFQYNASLKVFDLATGRIVFQGEYPDYDTRGPFRKARVAGNLLLTDKYIMDKRNGRVLFSEYREKWVQPEHQGDGKFFIVIVGQTDETALYAIDTDTCESRIMDEGESYYDYEYVIVGERLFLLRRGKSASGPGLLCIDPANGAVEWERRLSDEASHLRLWDGAIHIFPFMFDRKDAATTMEAFSLSGESLPAVTPGSERHERYFAKYHSERTRKSAGSMWKYEALRMLFDHKYRTLLRPETFPDGPIVGYAHLNPHIFDDDDAHAKEWAISFPDFVNNHIILLYDNFGRQWERRVNCLDYNHLLDSIMEFWHGTRVFFPKMNYALGGNHILYATNTGKVECIERSTGRSVWLYSFPRLDWKLWTEGFSFFRPRFSIGNWWSNARFVSLGLGWDGRPFLNRLELGAEYGQMYYDEDKRILEYDLSPEWMRGVSAVDEAAPAPTRAILDPNPPSPDFPETGRVAFVCAYLPYAAVVAVWLAATRRVRLRWRAVLQCVILLLIAWAVYSYGRYSAAALANMIVGLSVTLAGLVVTGARAALPTIVAGIQKGMRRNL